MNTEIISVYFFGANDPGSAVSADVNFSRCARQLCPVDIGLLRIGLWHKAKQSKQNDRGKFDR